MLRKPRHQRRHRRTANSSDRGWRLQRRLVASVFPTNREVVLPPLACQRGTQLADGLRFVVPQGTVYPLNREWF